MHKIQLSPEIVERSHRHRGRKHILENIDPLKTALVVVDMQIGFMAPGGPLEIPFTRDIVGNINQLSAAMREAGGLNVFLRFTFDENEPLNWSFWYDIVSSPEAKENSRKTFSRDSPKFQLWPELDVRQQDIVLDKTRFSGFVPGTCALDDLLRERDIDTIIVTGTMTNCCSESTARDAAQRNYKVIFVADGNATLTDEEHNATLNNMQSLFGDVMMTDKILSVIAARRAESALEN